MLSDFQHIDPLTGHVPNLAFGEHFAEIARRAREVLAYRSDDEISVAIWFIDEVLDRYFEQVKTESGAGGDHQPSNPEPDRCISGRDYVNEVWAFKQCYDWYKLTDDSGFKEAKDYHYFAVLALCKLDEAIGWLSKTRIFVEVSALRSDPSVYLSLAGASVLEAMDAVCYAEYLLLAESTRLMLQNTKQEVHKIAEEKTRQHISSRNKRAAVIRHARKTYPLKAYAIQVYLRVFWKLCG